MINKAILQDALSEYKRDFPVFVWKDEQFKWQAIKWFQDHWDIETEDFAKMLEESLSKTFNLLNSGKYFAKNMIVGFAYSEPEYVRAMFRELYDESIPLQERLSAFNSKAVYALEHFAPKAKNHFQDEKAISMYLWLRYPDKHYPYKYVEVRNMMECLESNYVVKKGKWNLLTTYKLYDEMLEVIREDKELIDLFESSLSEDCYPDPAYHTLTFDVGFYISRYYMENMWFGKDYDPGLSVADWKALLEDDDVFTTPAKVIMKRFKDIGGEATCVQLAEKYGDSYGFYNGGSVQLAKRICQKTNISPQVLPDGNNTWWTVLYTGRSAKKDERGEFVWKLREELSSALDQVDLDKIDLYSNNDDQAGTKPMSDGDKRYWWITANPKNWSFSLIDVGQTIDYTLYNDNGNKRRIFQHFLDAREGDLVICYEGHPVKQIVALGRVAKEQDGEVIYIEKTEVLVSPIDYATLHEAPELAQMEYFINPQGTIFEVKEDEYNYIIDLIREDNPVRGASSHDPYSKQDFLEEVFMEEEQYDTLVAVLQNKLNLILQGAPGVGKTFAAKRLAYSMMGEKDDSRIEFIQFHQNYSYEDFMMGYKPVDEGFELTFGVFYRFCQKAANNPSKDFFFIIDEINRGNMSKIFGELLMLIERDYRGKKATLAYSGMSFSVPENLYIIGMMNTADRSLAMIDYALRRRFSFFELKPGFDSKGFVQYQKRFNNATFDKLIDEVKALNQEIIKDNSLGKGFCIGHSYFCERTTISEEWMKSVVDYDIIPMLQEYWFDDETKLQKWEATLHGVFQ